MHNDAGYLLPPEPVADLAAYMALGGGSGLERAREIGSDGVIAEIRSSGLRGRGGAGFPTGFKWSGLAADPCDTKFVVCNAAEGEPGTFKDRALIRHNPYQLLEGIAIASEALGVQGAFIGIKEKFTGEVARLGAAAAEMVDAGLWGDVPLTIVEGPDDYLFGEEKALLEVVSGNDPLPRIDPPYIRGLFTTPNQPDNPAVVNNVETLSNVAHILRNGVDWFRSMGTERSPGNMIFTISGDVRREGYAELPMGTPLTTLINEVGGGLLEGRTIKAVVSGASNRPIPAWMIDTPLDFESMKQAGAGLGSGGFIVYDDTASMVEAATVYSRFLSTSSCGQCPPCKVGGLNMTDLLEKLLRGGASSHDLEDLAAWTTRVTDSNRCGLGAAHREAVGGFLEVFWDEFEARVDNAEPVVERLELPKLADYDEAAGRFRKG